MENTSDLPQKLQDVYSFLLPLDNFKGIDNELYFVRFYVLNIHYSTLENIANIENDFLILSNEKGTYLKFEK